MTSGLLFTSEEAAFLKQLVLTDGNENKLKDYPTLSTFQKKDAYLLIIEVNNLEPFERFSRGLEVENKSK